MKVHIKLLLHSVSTKRNVRGRENNGRITRFAAVRSFQRFFSYYYSLLQMVALLVASTVSVTVCVENWNNGARHEGMEVREGEAGEGGGRGTAGFGARG